MQEFKKHRVGPTKSGDVLSVSFDYSRFRRSRHYIIFFPNRVIPSEILRYHRKKLSADSVCLPIISVAAQPFGCQELDRSPAIREIPLCLALGAAHRQAASLFK